MRRASTRSPTSVRFTKPTGEARNPFTALYPDPKSGAGGRATRAADNNVLLSRQGYWNVAALDGTENARLTACAGGP